MSSTPETAAEPPLRREDMTPMEHLQALQARKMIANPMAETVGWHYADLAPGKVRLTATPGPHLYNAFTLHGGTIAALLDAAMSASIRTLLTRPARTPTTELKITYIAPVTAESGELSIHAESLYQQGSLGYAQGKVVGADGTVYALGSASFRVKLLEGGAKAVSDA